MRTLSEEIATAENGRYSVQFGRVIIGQYERYYFRVNGEIVALRPDSIGAFLDKINAYMSSSNTLNGTIHKSGVSIGNANTTQITDYQPSEHTPVNSADFTRGLNP